VPVILWRHSYTEPHLATDNELVRNVLLALLPSLAKVEAQKIAERTKAGMARAQAKGIRIGRPKLPAELRHEIIRRAARGETAYAIAKSLHIDRHTAAKYLQTWSHSCGGLHIYHYALYEPAALKWLMGRYATRENEIDKLLRAGLFVDLYAIVRHAIRASVESYSIKTLEPL
jgi:hypothetical protein